MTHQTANLPELCERTLRTRHGSPYEAYRPTRVWGVRRIPVHWTEKPLKHIVSINSDKLPDSTDPDFELEYVDIGNVSLTDGITSTERLRFETAPSRARRRVRHGDTIVSTVRTYLKAVAHIIEPPANLVVSTGFAVLRAKSALFHEYLYRLAQSEPFVHAIVAHSVGVSYPAINAPDIGRFYVAIPPTHEQQLIAAFLDRETSRIDKLIAKKQQLIALLSEERATLISRVVTNGLDGKARTKDSGIPWLARVPAHWQIMRLKRVLRSSDYGVSDSLNETGEVAVLRMGNLPRERIFEFKRRSLVHFAVDPDVVWMTTQLSGNKTFFLPFNKGNGTGAGNPDNPNGYKTAYLWEEVWQRDSLLDILGRFVHLQIEEKTYGGKKIRKESMIFPRYHQLVAVRSLEADAKAKGIGQNYLIQHSAGSGKSNSIAWLAHRLASLHDAQDGKIFDSVIVITDRRVLDRQLQDTIYQFDHKQGVVQKIDEDSGQLATALKTAVPIIITTLQKFPFVADKVGDLPDRKYAVIVDEAHSSQSGEAASELKGVLAANSIKLKAKEEAEAQGLPDHEEEILKTMARRGKQPNISFFAFTATPKYKTLEVFGTKGPDNKPRPFHLCSSTAWSRTRISLPST